MSLRRKRSCRVWSSDSSVSGSSSTRSPTAAASSSELVASMAGWLRGSWGRAEGGLQPWTCSPFPNPPRPPVLSSPHAPSCPLPLEAQKGTRESGVPWHPMGMDPLRHMARLEAPAEPGTGQGKMRPLASGMLLGPWLLPDPAMPRSPRHCAGAGSPWGPGTRQSHIHNGTEDSFPGHCGAQDPVVGMVAQGRGRTLCSCPPLQGKQGPGQETWTPAPYSWGRDEFSLCFLSASWQGEAGVGKGQAQGWGSPGPPDSPAANSTQGLSGETVLLSPHTPPIPHPSLQSSCIPWGDLHPRFTAPAQVVNPAPLIGTQGKFTSEEVGKDGANGAMKMAPSGAAPLAAASGQDGRASRRSLQPPPAQGTSTETPMLLGVGPQGEHPWVGTRVRDPCPSSRAALGSPQSSPWCQVSELPMPHGLGGLLGWGYPGIRAVETGCPRPAPGCGGGLGALGWEQRGLQLTS